MAFLETFVFICIIFFATLAVPVTNYSLMRLKDTPVNPKFQGYFGSEEDQKEIAQRLKEWNPQDGNLIWELSGLQEGDIMMDENDEKNAALNKSVKWPNAIIPYHINEEDFTKEQIGQIQEAIHSYHNQTCIRFRLFKKEDKNYITIRGNSSGCWSYVGKHEDGQVVNLQTPSCLRSGTIIHEFMHALGFYHQQSAADRDEWISIIWDNIVPGREHNFEKYDNGTVTDYGVGYDYGSVMHYSSTAFSKNGEKTIIPKMENVSLGQRHGFSDKDIEKINLMYKFECETRQKDEESEEEPDSNIITDLISSLWPSLWFSKF